MTILIIWIIVFIASMAVMVKGADWFLESAEKIGLALGLSSFIVGVTIVGLGTSFPELIASIAAVMQGATEIVVSNAIGSNISNILLIIGVSALIARKLVVTRSLIDLDLPILAIATVILIGAVSDRVVTSGEAIILFISYLIYLLHTVVHNSDRDYGKDKILPSRRERRAVRVNRLRKLKSRDFGVLIIGVAGLLLGAKFLVDSVVNISSILNISAGVISISAVAVGTSLPELIVSVKAALKGKSEVAIGNIFGSNAFNALVVIGIPGIFRNLEVDEKTFYIGVPVMAMATLVFVISGISRRIHLWEGGMYIMLYLLFIGKLFNLI